ncbi:Zn2-Cys6 binuclear cluster domain protein [Aspergillus parasiticus SU-1]|uniref:Zn2-Cys6 binuclear cluster domain protein n=1 Tax=Aspergillus parasiticus (strain ATCC 56775 / NRRL 5862 / SRRC 143 / SU-1) TaxID=1403190 RepID=A0A0F0IAY8_ASPPU|nr:Zn2-Cys6 binuclear cluster domain protein [Aspergillus parasiticus SU-1]
MMHVTRPPGNWLRSNDPRHLSTSPVMKRRSGPELHQKPQKRVTRQDPVSCESCRRKKLKCNRQQPCSSCVTRRLPCSYVVAPAAADTRNVGSEDGNRRESTIPGQLNTPELQEMRSADSQPVANPQPSYRSRESLMTADWLENIHMGQRVPTATPKLLRDELDELRNKGASVPPGTLLPVSCRSWNASREDPGTVNLLSFLPHKHEALALFQYYTNYIDYLYHIIFPKRVEDQIDGIYRAIERGQPPNLNHLALFFSIAASSLFLQLSVESSIHAELCSREFSFLTGASLIQSNYPVNPTVEGLQAAMVIMHHASNISSHPSVSGLFVHGSVISQAKNLKLHCIDSPRLREANPSDVVEMETKRRLWWDIASFLGFLSGPQEWTYLINPEHMKVDRPLNLDDDEFEGHSGLPRPISTPTDMSFSLERLKLGIVCREVIDATSHEHLYGIEVSYEKILELDRKFHQALAEIPDFFRLDPTSRRRFASLYQSRPTIAWQRCLLQQGYFSRLCRLHRQFFIRGAREPLYSYSHIVCLQSARKVLEIKRIMDEDEPKFTPPSSVVWSVMHHVFMAAVILLLDVCFNWDDILAEKRKEEVLDACRMLSNAQLSSSLVKEGINAMMGVLQKHWKYGKLAASPDRNSSLNVNPVGLDAPRKPLPSTSGASYTPATTIELDPPGDLASNVGDTSERQLEDIWSEMLDNGANLDLGDTDWTGLLTELTNATMPG